MEQMRQSNRINAENGGVVITVGVAEFDPETDKSLDAVFVRADAVMYEEKKALKASAQKASHK